MREERPTRDEFVFVYALRVRWSEIDAQGVVFNPNYLVYADIAMTEYQREIGLPYPEALIRHGADTFAVRAETDFLGSAMYDDTVDLAARCEYLGRTSFRMRTAIFRGDELLTAIRMTYVNVALQDRRPTPLSDEFVRAVQTFEKTAPLRK